MDDNRLDSDEVVCPRCGSDIELSFQVQGGRLAIIFQCSGCKEYYVEDFTEPVYEALNRALYELSIRQGVHQC